MTVSSSPEYVIDIRNLSVSYGNILALQDINMQVARGDFVGIIGPNGGGKSTLLKSILGLVTPVKGSIAVLGKSPVESRSQLGYVPQATAINREFPISVREAVLMGRMVSQNGFMHRYQPEDHDITQHYLQCLEISNLADRQIGQLSGGQLQRVLIARALVVQPQILLLDEPTASLDAHSSSQIYELLQGLNQQVTILVVTHDSLAVSSYLKTIACINRTLYYHGGPELSNELVMQIYGCPVELIAHGVPHRVLGTHDHGGNQ